MQITEQTKVSDILDSYGDLAQAMEVLGIRSVGSLGVRRRIAKLINVKTAAKIHRVPVMEMVDKLNTAIQKHSKEGK